ncbi:uncharacterized protein A4U43_C03F2640 [Asparagus officinalis]|uniref:Neprosin PEP catalytic domain-containing protein n=1 Tax=Asparagus officinalis TaxID=4686 RepID=A0A5P1F9J3_ASPOF|nr:uncharacterized protein A4U43_C03F2640 [Asparagus officinalis]
MTFLAQNEAFLQKVGRPERNYISNHASITVLPDRVGHFAQYRSREGQWGSQAELVVYGLPNIKRNQYSAVFIGIANGLDGPSNNVNSISAGWHGDGSKITGCYNLLCNGFVPENKASSKLPGFKIEPLSEYNGVQHVVKVKIHQDENSGDWWLHVDNSPIGFWPKTLFTGLSQGAQEISWGGAVNFDKNDDSPPMGSGHFPEEGEGKAAAIQNIQFADKSGNTYALTDGEEFAYDDRTDCYRLGEFINEKTGSKFYFGGVGGIIGGCK